MQSSALITMNSLQMTANSSTSKYKTKPTGHPARPQSHRLWQRSTKPKVRRTIISLLTRWKVSWKSKFLRWNRSCRRRTWPPPSSKRTDVTARTYITIICPQAILLSSCLGKQKLQTIHFIWNKAGSYSTVLGPVTKTFWWCFSKWVKVACMIVRLISR